MTVFVPAILTPDIQDAKLKLDFLASVSGVTDIHLDIADGVFVPSKTITPREIPANPRQLKIEAHMMVNNPSLYFQDLEHAGVRAVIIHYESFSQLDELITTIDNLKTLHLRVGVSINPETGVDVFDKFISKIDCALLMSVHPGFQGGTFVPETFERLRDLRLSHKDIMIEIDGGVTLENFDSLMAHGANRLVVGSAIWKSPDPKQTIVKFLEKLRN